MQTVPRQNGRRRAHLCPCPGQDPPPKPAECSDVAGEPAGPQPLRSLQPPGRTPQPTPQRLRPGRPAHCDMMGWDDSHASVKTPSDRSGRRDSVAQSWSQCAGPSRASKVLQACTGSPRACSEQQPPQKHNRESSSCWAIGAPSCHRGLVGTGRTGRPVGMVKGQPACVLDPQNSGGSGHATGESRRLLWDDNGQHNPAIPSARHRSPRSGDSRRTNLAARAQVRKPALGRKGQRPRRKGPGPS